MTSPPGCNLTAYILNANKTEFLWFATPRRQDQLPVDVIPIGGHDITPAASVHNLGVYFDSELSMRRHIDVITENCYCYALFRQLYAPNRRHTSSTVMQLLMTSLALSRLDYCNSALFGLPASIIHRLQAVQNAAARLVFNIRRSKGTRTTSPTHSSRCIG